MITKKLVDFKETKIIVEKYAKENCEDNFSMAVRKLIKKGEENEKKN